MLARSAEPRSGGVEKSREEEIKAAECGPERTGHDKPEGPKWPRKNNPQKLALAC